MNSFFSIAGSFAVLGLLFTFFACQAKKITMKRTQWVREYLIQQINSMSKIHRLIKIAKNQGFSLKFRKETSILVTVSSAYLNFLTAETLIFSTRFL